MTFIWQLMIPLSIAQDPLVQNISKKIGCLGLCFSLSRLNNWAQGRQGKQIKSTCSEKFSRLSSATTKPYLKITHQTKRKK
jgi:hypothetical protein